MRGWAVRMEWTLRGQQGWYRGKHLSSLDGAGVLFYQLAGSQTAVGTRRFSRQGGFYVGAIRPA